VVRAKGYSDSVERLVEWGSDSPSVSPDAVDVTRWNLAAAERRLMLRGACAALALLTASGCASAGHLAEYDFRDRAVGVVSVAPPHPEVFTRGDFWFVRPNLVDAGVRVAAEIVREVEAERARARLDSAVVRVDVAQRMSARVLEQGARQLRARPVERVQESDFEIELRVRRYGIEADSWDDQARFVIEAEVLLLDAASGREIWKSKLDEKERVSSGVLGWALPDAVGGAVTAGQLAGLSVAEMERALESLADYCADRMMDSLRRGLEKARG
jgi:hypothetical protein